ncbi:MAG: peptidylprolyl isomerase [Pseudonocardia sp.]
MSTNQQRREAAKRKLERQQQKRGQRDQRRKRVAAITAVVIVVAVVAATVALATIGTGPSTPPGDTAASPPTAGTTEAAPPPIDIPTQLAAPLARPTPFPATVSCAYPPDEPAAKPVNPPPTSGVSARGSVPVSLATTAGQIDLVLDRALAPCTVNNFISLAQQGYLTGTTCHRLTTGPGLQVLQCGDPTGTGSGGPGYRFADETFPELTYGRGQIAMANAGPDTNGSQFFMIYGDASGLSPDYTVFGTIAPASLGVLDTVARNGLEPGRGSGDGRPRTEVTITAAKVG